MNSQSFHHFDSSRVPSPCFVVDEVAIENNLKTLARIQNESGAKVLLALKAFSMFSLAPLIDKYLTGICASGLHEAKLGKEEFNGEVHTYSAAFAEQDISEILNLSDHLVFNSFAQWKRFQPQIKQAKQAKPSLEFGLRLNPMHSEGATEIYDPCAPGSRLGILPIEFEHNSLDGISGLHFHTLCEQSFEPLARTLDVIEEKFANILPNLKWVNFGGGHHITAADYPVEALIERIKQFQAKYDVQVYLEPGEAIAINTGVLVCEVLDLTRNDIDIAILDTSATCHMPDTIEMPYRADIFGSGQPDEKAFKYRLGGQTCLAGDVMGVYSFDSPLAIGQRLMFDDMSHYTMVKTTTFNGIGLPSIAIWNSKTDKVNLVKTFGYEDFKNRLS
ncbi:carboxynorspermidine decarboxylase [Catenovulum adriaticum]|uniref:Carboxynorspermidine/carboxyspermidine decarboxylase n=1 Tax=Catenovulum adriaticum TaxID=2984846 RepID=A0ABY7AUW8_9ALTE|nr:carboxynorspermidine decarboxylase [Catenovulum sp. TS8]WAJ72056.1 carboxynorspermidine decarboxylase [Catenovulum sp. TS8]